MFNFAIYFNIYSSLHMKIQKAFFALAQIITLVLLLVANSFILDFIMNIENGQEKSVNHFDLKECQTSPSGLIFGFDPKHFSIETRKMPFGKSLSELFRNNDISGPKSEKLIKNISELIDLRNLRSGNTYGFIASNPCIEPDYFIYEIDASKYLTCELKGDHCVNLQYRNSELKREHASGIIESSLWNALEGQNLSLDLIDQMEDALSSSVDFHHVQKGNTFKLIYNRLYIEGKPTQSGELLAAYFETDYGEHFSISFKPNNKKGFYNLKGSPMVSRFLQAPVRFSRISSGFNMRRFHPVLKYSRPHLGTDYAAPHGTPILSVGAGVVEAASYTSGNGNFVKIRHDNTYQTQYLHMSKFAKGIRKGTPVSQGQVIGYVGSTGLASGPHVCFRFWKNGVQVNHRNLHFPSPDPLPKNQLEEYFKHRDNLVQELNSIQFSTAINTNKNS